MIWSPIAGNRGRKRTPKSSIDTTGQPDEGTLLRLLWSFQRRNVDMWRLVLCIFNSACESPKLAIEVRAREDMRRALEDHCLSQLRRSTDWSILPSETGLRADQSVSNRANQISSSMETILIDCVRREGLFDLEASQLASAGGGGGPSALRSPGSKAHSQWEASIRDIAKSDVGADKMLAVWSALNILPSPIREFSNQAKLVTEAYRVRERISSILKVASDSSPMFDELEIVRSIASQRKRTIEQGIQGVLDADTAQRRRRFAKDEAERLLREKEEQLHHEPPPSETVSPEQTLHTLMGGDFNSAVNGALK